MEMVSKGYAGIFTLSRDQIVGTDGHLTEIRKKLNSEYTLRQLVGCRSFFMVIIENTPNQSGFTKFSDNPRTNLDNLLTKYRSHQLSFGNRKLRNGSWVDKSPTGHTRKKRDKTSHPNNDFGSKEVKVEKGQPKRKKVTKTRIRVSANVR